MSPRSALGDVASHLGSDLQTFAVGPVTGNNGAIATGSALPGLLLGVTPTVPSNLLVSTNVRLENGAATWTWSFTALRVDAGSFTFRSVSAASNYVDLATYYNAVNWAHNKGWELFKIPAGYFQLQVTASAAATTVNFTAQPESYILALMWPQS